MAPRGVASVTGESTAGRSYTSRPLHNDGATQSDSTNTFWLTRKIIKDNIRGISE